MADETKSLGIGAWGPSQGAPSDDGEPTIYDDRPEPGPELAAVDVAPEVPEPVVRGLLAGLGGLLGASPLAEESIEDHWRFTERELDDLTPPLTRIVNARPQLRAAAARGDELVIAVQLAGYIGRNYTAGAEVRRAREELNDGYFDPEAPRDAPGADGPARGVARDNGAWPPAPAGTGVAPPQV